MSHPKQWLQSPIELLAELIAASTAFQSWVGAGSAAAALNHIYDTAASEGHVPILAATTGPAGSASFAVQGDLTDLLAVGTRVRVFDARGGAEGTYTLRSGSAFADGVTTINVAEELLDGTTEGVLVFQWMPRCLIGSKGGRSRRKISTRGWVTEGGEGLWMQFEQETADAHWDPALGIDNPSAAKAAFAAVIEDIVDDIEELAGVDTGSTVHLDVREITEETPVLEGERRENGGRPFWWVILGVGTR